MRPDEAKFALNLGLNEAGLVFQVLEAANGVYMDLGTSQPVSTGQLPWPKGMHTNPKRRLVRRLYRSAVADRPDKVREMNEEGVTKNDTKTDVSLLGI